MGRRDGGHSSDLVDPLGQGWGRGEFYPEFGIWQWYEYPERHPESGGGSVSFTWAQIVGEWRWIVADFRHFYQCDLRDVWPSASWSWFHPLLVGLLQQDSLLRSALMPRR